jgi:tRNA (adenine22-N1)-methyltransferase
MCQNGYYIENEEFVKENKFIYQILIFKKGKRKYTKKEYFFGPVFLVKKGPLFREYYEREKKSREILLQLLPKNYYLKRYKTKNEIKMIKNEIED